jgi:hypothetical protein
VEFLGRARELPVNWLACELRKNWLNPPDLVRIEPEIVSDYPDGIVPKDTASAAKLRERTLTNLYNQRSQWSIDTHRDLDAAVAAAYCWPADITTAKHRSIEVC